MSAPSNAAHRHLIQARTAIEQELIATSAKIEHITLELDQKRRAFAAANRDLLDVKNALAAFERNDEEVPAPIQFTQHIYPAPGAAEKVVSIATRIIRDAPQA